MTDRTAAAAAASDTTNNNEINEKEAWILSKSKGILRMGLLNRTITSKIAPKVIYDMNEKHHKWEYSNLCNNFRNFHSAIDRDQRHMGQDCFAYGHDLAIVRAFQEAKFL